MEGRGSAEEAFSFLNFDGCSAADLDELGKILGPSAVRVALTADGQGDLLPGGNESFPAEEQGVQDLLLPEQVRPAPEASTSSLSSSSSSGQQKVQLGPGFPLAAGPAVEGAAGPPSSSASTSSASSSYFYINTVTANVSVHQGRGSSSSTSSSPPQPQQPPPPPPPPPLTSSSIVPGGKEELQHPSTLQLQQQLPQLQVHHQHNHHHHHQQQQQQLHHQLQQQHLQQQIQQHHAPQHQQHLPQLHPLQPPQLVAQGFQVPHQFVSNHPQQQQQQHPHPQLQLQFPMPPMGSSAGLQPPNPVSQHNHPHQMLAGHMPLPPHAMAPAHHLQPPLPYPATGLHHGNMSHHQQQQQQHHHPMPGLAQQQQQQQSFNILQQQQQPQQPLPYGPQASQLAAAAAANFFRQQPSLQQQQQQHPHPPSGHHQQHQLPHGHHHQQQQQQHQQLVAQSIAQQPPMYPQSTIYPNSYSIPPGAFGSSPQQQQQQQPNPLALISPHSLVPPPHLQGQVPVLLPMATPQHIQAGQMSQQHLQQQQQQAMRQISPPAAAPYPGGGIRGQSNNGGGVVGPLAHPPHSPHPQSMAPHPQPQLLQLQMQPENVLHPVGPVPVQSTPAPAPASAAHHYNQQNHYSQPQQQQQQQQRPHVFHDEKPGEVVGLVVSPEVMKVDGNVPNGHIDAKGDEVEDDTSLAGKEQGQPAKKSFGKKSAVDQKPAEATAVAADTAVVILNGGGGGSGDGRAEPQRRCGNVGVGGGALDIAFGTVEQEHLQFGENEEAAATLAADSAKAESTADPTEPEAQGQRAPAGPEGREEDPSPPKMIPDSGGAPHQIPTTVAAASQQTNQGPSNPVASQPSKSWASLFKSGDPVGPTQGSVAAAQHSTHPIVVPGSQGEAAVPAGSTSQKPTARITPLQQQQQQQERNNSNSSRSSSKDSSSSSSRRGTTDADKTLSKDESEMASFLKSYTMNHRASPIKPRGLSNRSNWCFVNAVLQALLACPPFYNLIRSMPVATASSNSNESNGPDSYPVVGASSSSLNNGKALAEPRVRGGSMKILRAVQQFFSEFSTLDHFPKLGKREKGEKKNEDLPQGKSLEPSSIYNVLLNLNSSDTFKVIEGRQEDAEEFLTFLLNGLNDEMMALLKLLDREENNNVGSTNTTNSNSICNGGTSRLMQQSAEPAGGQSFDDSDDGDQWREVGPKNRSCITRRGGDLGGFARGSDGKCIKTPLAEMFQGQMRSCVQQQNGEPTATLQTFLTLQLDIQSEKVRNVHDALVYNFGTEVLDGYICSKTKQEVMAERVLSLDELPPILVLHLKRFVYNETSSGCQKLLKNIGFPVDLEVGRGVLSPNSRNRYMAKQTQYKLFAVVYHNGTEATKGHYIADVYHTGLSTWLRCDDSILKTESIVQAHSSTSVPYILFYRRCDTMIGGGGVGVDRQQQQNGPSSSSAQHVASASSSSSSSAPSTSVNNAAGSK